MGYLAFEKTIYDGALTYSSTAPVDSDGNSDPIYNGENGSLKKFSVQGVISSTLPAGSPEDQFVAGVKEIFTVTPLAQASASASDHFYFYDWDANSWAVWLNTDGLQTVPTVGSPEATLASTYDNVIEVDLTSYGTKEVSTVTFDQLSEIENGDYFVVKRPDGYAYAVWLQKSSTWDDPALLTGSPQAASAYSSADQKVYVDITSVSQGSPDLSGTGSPYTLSGEDVADLVYTELTKSGCRFAEDFSVTQNDNILTITCNYPGNTTNIASYNADGTASSGSPISAYGLTVATGTAGSLSSDVSEVVLAIQSAVESAFSGSPTSYYDVDVTDSPATTLTFTAREEGAVTNAANSGGSPNSFVVATTQAGVNGVSITTDEIYLASHGYETGTAVTVTTDSSPQDVPAPLAVSTTYYVIDVDTNHIKLATTAANAVAGTAINITDVGTGTHIVVPTALSGSTVKLQYSNDKTNWLDVSGYSQTVDNPASNADDFIWSVVDPAAKYYRVNLAITSGQLDVTLTAVGYKESY